MASACEMECSRQRRGSQTAGAAVFSFVAGTVRPEYLDIMRVKYSLIRRRIVTSIAVIGLLLLAGIVIALYALAPTLHLIVRKRTADYLRERFKSSVQFTDFHISMYPHTHIIIDGLVMRHEGRTDVAPLIQISTVTVDAKFENLLATRPFIAHVTLDGLRINTPPHQPGGEPMIHGTHVDLSAKFPVTIARITANEARVVILRRDTKPPREFEVHQLEMDNVNFDHPASFHALLTNPVPKGEIHCDGQFGPWQANNPSQTPVRANYTFHNADMSTLKGLKGILSSEGTFSGPLDYLNVEGKTDIPDFALRTSDHPMALHTDFSAVVDGTNGNTYLNLVTAKFRHTTIVTKGEVVDEYPTVKGRTIVMNAVSKSARIEDLLLLAVKSNPPVMTGAANLKARILIPEGPLDLIKRLQIDGQFDVGAAQFTSDSVQAKVNSLSRRGQGKPKDMDLTAVSKLQGAFRMDGDEIDFSRLSFSVPGADINLAGNYGFDSGVLNFRGKLLLQAKLSQTFTGAKSFFLKAVDPFFKGKNGEKAGTVLPIKIIGTKDHPVFGLDFRDRANKDRKNKDPLNNGPRDQIAHKSF